MKYILTTCLSFLLLNASAQTLVLPGDHPDPSVVKIGDTYWATATTSNWAPVFPVLKSKDLINWEHAAQVFTELPAWSDYYFWAPEISYDNGKVFVYYSAHKRDGNLCLAVASADKPEGPYRDHGTLMCQPVGSIDAFPMRDENGKLHLIWKEDGNSVQEPTPIWIMEMNEARTALIGKKRELFRNDAPWEANLVEGVSMIRHGEYIYAFYAGAGCCGPGCSYAMGVARAKELLGPWEKYEKNPLFKSEEEWKCPGHGTPVEKDGRYFLLYHGYHADDGVYVGRQGLLKEFRFSADGWIELVNEDATDVDVPSNIYDAFNGNLLSHQWQWSVFHRPDHMIKNGKLELSAIPGGGGNFLGQKIFSEDYEATVTMFTTESTADAGLAVIGDEKNLMALTLAGRKLSLWKLQDGKKQIIHQEEITSKEKIHLRAKAVDGSNLQFHYSTDGVDFQKFHENTIDGTYLPPWDRAIRVGLIAHGKTSDRGLFDDFKLKSK